MSQQVPSNVCVPGIRNFETIIRKFRMVGTRTKNYVFA